MKTKRFFLMFALLLLTVISYGQISGNKEGNFCIGNDSCFWGFNGAINNQLATPRWTNVASTTLNVGGGLSIAAMDTYMPAFSVSAPYKTNYGISISSFFSISKNGRVYSRDGIVQSSDSTLKTNITVLTSTLSKIKSLKGVSYNFKREVEGINEEFTNSSRQRNLKKNNDSSKHIGLLAQDVEKVYPEVVRTLDDNTKGIAYADLVAVLIEGIKELNDSLTTVSNQYTMLQEQIDRLEMQIENMQTTPAPELEKFEKGTSGNYSKMSDSALDQNTPNPFGQNTEISYRLSPDTQNAFINIYNLNGRQLKQYPLNTTSSTGKVEVNASEFTPGMYIYALVINGKVIDSKRMQINNLN